MDISNYKQVPTWWKQRTFNLFRKRYKESNNTIFFIGAGLSMSSGLPRWSNLLGDLAKKCEDSFQKHIITALNSSTPNYQEIAATLEGYYENRKLGSFRGELNKIFNIENISEVHKTLARLSWKNIITTNFDPLIEAAIKDDKVIICTPEKPEDVTDLKIRHIFKIHGDIKKWDSKLILTKQDFEERYTPSERLHNAVKKEELYSAQLSSGKSPGFHNDLISLLKTAELIVFLGYSHDDPYFNQLYEFTFDQLDDGNLKEKVFGLVTREEGLDAFEGKIKDRSKRLKINFIKYSADNQHREVLEFLEYLDSLEEDKSSYKLESIYLQMERVKRPTVVMLYCGGTIGASSKDHPYDGAPSKLEIHKSRFDQSRKEFSETLLDWFNQTHNTENQSNLEIEWEILPPDQQMFSENATPEYWSSIKIKIEEVIFKYFQAPSLILEGTLPNDEKSAESKKLNELYLEEDRQYSLVYNKPLSEKQFINEINNRYVLGIILLHGTDTLAYTTSALSFGLHKLPCPIVITGANNPPEEKSLRERIQYNKQSDAWTNLQNSIYFLQAFGHRLTEVFVCFGDTIHHGINLRKNSLDMVPFDEDQLLGKNYKPFGFHNYSFLSQYMFKLIDGIFCDNYYTKSPDSPSYKALVNFPTEFRDLAHIRFDGLKEKFDPESTPLNFSSQVKYTKITPNCLPVDIDKIRSESVRVVLLEGYTSATYPTDKRNPFSQILIDLYDLGIPIFLVSNYGMMPNQMEYQTTPLEEHPTYLRKLYGILGETALPLLSLIVNKISQQKWDEKFSDHKKLIDNRVGLIEKGLNEFFKRKNIISEMLRGITSKDFLQSRLEKYKTKEYEIISKQGERYRDRRYKYEKPNYSSEKIEKDFFTMGRKDFVLFIDEIVRSGERKGTGPDDLADIYNIGFNFGFNIAASYEKHERVNDELYFSRDRDSQEKLFNKANQILNNFVNLIIDTNLSEIGLSTDIQSIAINQALTIDPKQKSFGFKIEIRKLLKLQKIAGKYDVTSFSREEEQFFTELKKGLLERDELKKIYYEQIKKTWRKATTLDFFLLGLFKGLACKLAETMRFNQWAIDSRNDNDSSNALIFLRQSVRIMILESIEDMLEVEFICYGK